jgi:hypothetical protein
VRFLWSLRRTVRAGKGVHGGLRVFVSLTVRKNLQPFESEMRSLCDQDCEHEISLHWSHLSVFDERRQQTLPAVPAPQSVQICASVAARLSLQCPKKRWSLPLDVLRGRLASNQAPLGRDSYRNRDGRSHCDPKRETVRVEREREGGLTVIRCLGS